MIDAMVEIDATLACVLAAHRPIGAEEPLIETAGAFAATANALSGWVQHAGVGRVCVYARAAWAPAGVATQARALAERGLVTLRQGRCASEPTLFDYMARRTDMQFRRVAPVLTALPLSAEAKLLLVHLESVAAAGRTCPSLADMAAKIGVRSAQSVSTILSRLIAAQAITLEFDPHSGWRGIEILATGARTAEQRS